MNATRHLRPATHSKRSLILAALACVAVGGCQPDGPERGDVEGVVTLDGKPLGGALLTFRPQAGGRPSYARTDENGVYELVYASGLTGALVDDHLVEISTETAGDPGQEIAPSPERLPPRFNSQSNLVKTVDAGDNEINFELWSRGPVRAAGR